MITEYGIEAKSNSEIISELGGGGDDAIHINIKF